MAPRAKARRKVRGTGSKAPGVVRFKRGFPPGIRDYIKQQLGTNWHLELRILDGDDGDGDDGNAGPSPFAEGSSKKAARSRRKTRASR